VAITVAAGAECRRVRGGVDARRATGGGARVEDFRVPEAFSYRGFAFDIDEIRAEETQALAARMAGWDIKYPDVQQHRVVAHDGAAHALLELAEQAHPVVVGTQGRGGVSRLLLGSTSHALMHHAPCPVIVVPSDWTG
jgi:nucleotide-binding universal stress UspA family protein